jgi:hypothetical protein
VHETEPAPVLALRWRVAGHVTVVATLLGLSVACFSRVWLSGHPSSTVLCQCGDPGQAVWFMSWVPWAIAHGHNPLFTTRMLAGQGGANLLESTSYLLQSFLLAPVTWLFGATASFNVAETLAPVLSGWAMYWASGRVATRFVARGAAAVFYGFSPFLLGSEAFGHLNFSWLWYPPLLFLALHEIVAGRRLRPALAGLLLGLLVVAEFFTGTEPLLLATLTAAVGLLVALALWPKVAWALRRRLGVAFGTALATAGGLLAYPLWFLLHGPRRVTGAPWPAIYLSGVPLGSIIRSNGSGPSQFWKLGGYFGAPWPWGSFLGLWLLVVLAASAPLLIWLRRTVAAPLVVSGLFAWLCSLGVFLIPYSIGARKWWLPWGQLSKLPLLANAGPQRFALVVSACAALMLALALESAGELLRRLAPRVTGRSIAGAVDLVMIALATVVTVPIATSYTLPFAMHSGQVPEWFTTEARALPPDTRVLTYPYASSGAPDAMYWQANDELSFELVGGRALIPGADGHSSQHVDPLRGTSGLLTNNSYGPGLLLPPSPVEVQALRASLAHWGVDRIVVVPIGRSPAWAVAWFSEGTGRLPTFEHGAAVWSLRDGRSSAPVREYPRATVERCEAQTVSESGLRDAIRCLAAAPAVSRTPVTH